MKYLRGCTMIPREWLHIASSEITKITWLLSFFMIQRKGNFLSHGKKLGLLTYLFKDSASIDCFLNNEILIQYELSLYIQIFRYCSLLLARSNNFPQSQYNINPNSLWLFNLLWTFLLLRINFSQALSPINKRIEITTHSSFNLSHNE